MELGRRIGVDDFYKYLEKFGMTQKTGIDKLDFIRIFISKVIVSNEDGNLKFNIIYKYEV